MLAEDYRMFSLFSEKELKSVWRKMKGFSVLIGGWAAHLLVKDAFFEWKRTEYIGSRDIDFGISLKNIESARAKKMRLHEVFYVYVDLIADQKNERYPYDELLGLILRKNFVKKVDNFIVPMPEALVLMKLRAMEQRSDEKLVKDLLDIFVISNLSRIDKGYFRELSMLYPFDKKLASCQS
jgi:hypothetical protein